MNIKDKSILEIRGESFVTNTEKSTLEEQFQNKTLRPILKLQNDLLIEVFKNYAVKQKSVLFTLIPSEKDKYIENIVQRDIKFRNSLKGIIIGMFTIEEYKEYIQNSSNINKRMMSLLIERIKSQIQLFEN
jgi:hypothetical protein